MTNLTFQEQKFIVECEAYLKALSEAKLTQEQLQALSSSFSNTFYHNHGEALDDMTPRSWKDRIVKYFIQLSEYNPKTKKEYKQVATENYEKFLRIRQVRETLEWIND